MNKIQEILAIIKKIKEGIKKMSSTIVELDIIKKYWQTIKIKNRTPYRNSEEKGLKSFSIIFLVVVFVLLIEWCSLNQFAHVFRLHLIFYGTCILFFGMIGLFFIVFVYKEKNLAVKLSYVLVFVAFVTSCITIETLIISKVSAEQPMTERFYGIFGEYRRYFWNDDILHKIRIHCLATIGMTMDQLTVAELTKLYSLKTPSEIWAYVLEIKAQRDAAKINILNRPRIGGYSIIDMMNIGSFVANSYIMLTFFGKLCLPLIPTQFFTTAVPAVLEVASAPVVPPVVPAVSALPSVPMAPEVLIDMPAGLSSAEQQKYIMKKIIEAQMKLNNIGTLLGETRIELGHIIRHNQMTFQGVLVALRYNLESLPSGSGVYSGQIRNYIQLIEHDVNFPRYTELTSNYSLPSGDPIRAIRLPVWRQVIKYVLEIVAGTGS